MGNGYALRILRIGGHPEGNLGHIFLFLVLQIIKQARSLSHHHRQYARCLRVQRAGVARLHPAQQTAHTSYHLCGGHARGLKHVEKAAQRFCLRHAFTLPSTSVSAPSTTRTTSARGMSRVRPLANRCPPPPKRSAT